MTLELQAEQVEVGVLSDWDAFVVSLAGEGEPPQWSLIFSLGLNPTQQDVELGQDTYAVSTHEQVTCYGGLKNWSNTGEKFTFNFEAAAAAILGIDETVFVIVEQSQTDQLSDGLRHLTESQD